MPVSLPWKKWFAYGLQIAGWEKTTTKKQIAGREVRINNSRIGKPWYTIMGDDHRDKLKWNCL